MNEEAIKLLHEDLKNSYDVGSLDDFKNYLLDNDKRQIFFDQVIKPRYAVNTIEDFNSVYGLKKKDDPSASISQEEGMESITEDPITTTLLESSEEPIKADEFIELTEEEAAVKLRDELAGKGFTVEETGLGNALLVTDNITGDQKEIDLRPIEFFGGSAEEGIQKIIDLQKVQADPRRKLLSLFKLTDSLEERANYINELPSIVPGLEVTQNEDGTTTFTKNGESTTISARSLIESDFFPQINKFIYENTTNEEAIDALDRYDVKLFDEYNKELEKEYNKTIDISDSAIETDIYNETYFSKLFTELEKAGVAVPEDAKEELSDGFKVYESRRMGGSGKVPFDKEDIQNGINKYFSNDPEVMNMISKFDSLGKVAATNDRVDRAKKLAKERVLENRTDRESFAELVSQKHGELTKKKKDIATNIEMASNDYKLFLKSLKNKVQDLRDKGQNVDIIFDEATGNMSLSSDEVTKEVNDLGNLIMEEQSSFVQLMNKSEIDLAKIDSDIEEPNKWKSASEKNYNIVDNALADVNAAAKEFASNVGIVISLAEEGFEDVTGLKTTLSVATGTTPEERTKKIREGLSESRRVKDEYYRTMRTYQEAIDEGSKGVFALRQLSTQSVNIGLAVATSGIGSSIGLSSGTISTLVSTGFGVSSSGAKYDELTTRQEMAQKAKDALIELEKNKEFIPESEYLKNKFELERASEDLDITPGEKTLSVLGSGIIEGVVSRVAGTVPNSLKVIKDVKAPAKFLDDILVSNFKAAKNAGWEITKRTGGEILEETSIDALNQLNNYLTIGDEMDFSQLDDVAVTSIITSGAMNVPSVAYGSILKQVNVNRYKSQVNGIVSQINNLQESLNDTSMPDGIRRMIHNSITSNVKDLAGVTTEMEGDALILGSDNLKDLLLLSGMEKSMLKQAGVEIDDSYEAANKKTQVYLESLDKGDAKKFTEKMNFINNKRKEIVGGINYEGAIEKVFGEKGIELSNTLDPKLTPKEKYVEVYKQLREELNNNAKNEYDAIQEQETRDIPDAEPTEGVQEVEEEVREPAVEETEEEVLVEPKTIEQLEEENKSTFPKIPTGKVFLNEPSQPSPEARKRADDVIEAGTESDLESQTISVKDIIPTQKNLTERNLRETADVGITEDPIIVTEQEGKFYVIDGHHRLANTILSGNQNAEVKVVKEPISETTIKKETEEVTEQLSPEEKADKDTEQAVAGEESVVSEPTEMPTAPREGREAKTIEEAVNNLDTDTDVKEGILKKINNFISGGRERFFGFVNNKISDAVNEIEGIESRMAELSISSKENIKEFKRALNKIKDKEQALKLVSGIFSPLENNTTTRDAYEKLKELSPRLANVTLSMRNHIDELSKIMLNDPSFNNIPQRTRDEISKNMGNYIHDTYLFFLDKNFKPSDKIKSKAYLEKANEILAENPSKMPEEAAKEAKEYIDGLLNRWESERNPSVIVKNLKVNQSSVKVDADALKAKTRKPQDKKLWAKSLSEAKKKFPKFKSNDKRVLAAAVEVYEESGGTFTALPQYLKDLLGQVKQPTSQYINTVMSMGNLIYKNQALKNIADTYMGEFIKKTDPSNKDFVQVSDEMSPLNNLWVHKSIVKELESDPLYKTGMPTLDFYYKVLNFSRRTKILPNPPTWLKNVTGGYFAQVLNGQFIGVTDPVQAAAAFAGRSKMIAKNERTEFTKTIWDEASKAGVLATGVEISTLGLIDDMYRHLDSGNDKLAATAAKKLWVKTKNGAQKLEEETSQRYAQIDDYTKAIMVFNGKYSMAKKMFGKEYDSLGEDQKNLVLKRTGAEVKVGTPTFSRLPSWFKNVARLPFGDFISFRVEAIRSFAGAVSIAYNDTKIATTGVDTEGNKISDVQRKEYAKSAARRIAGISTIVGMNVLVRDFMSVIYQHIFGDDEEEIILKENVKVLRPEWMDNNIIVKEVKENGDVIVIDYSGQDPYADVISMLRGDMEPLTENFSINMLTSSLMESYEGEDAFGNRIWGKEEGLASKLIKSLGHISYDAAMPTVPKSVMYEYGKRKKADENWGSIGDWSTLMLERTTFRTYDYNIYKRARSFAYEINSDGYSPRLGKGNSEQDVYYRIDNLSKMRERINVVTNHYASIDDKSKADENVDKLERTIDYYKNFSKEERDMIFSSEEEFNSYKSEIIENIEDYYNVEKTSDSFKIKKPELEL